MRLNQIEPKDADPTNSETRILVLEAGFKNYDELLKSYAKQLNQVKTKQVYKHPFYVFYLLSKLFQIIKINNKKKEMSESGALATNKLDQVKKEFVTDIYDFRQLKIHQNKSDP